MMAHADIEQRGVTVQNLPQKLRLGAACGVVQVQMTPQMAVHLAMELDRGRAAASAVDDARSACLAAISTVRRMRRMLLGNLVIGMAAGAALVLVLRQLGFLPW